MIYEVREIDHRLEMQPIGLAQELLAIHVALPDLQGRLMHSCDKVGSRTGSRGSRDNEIEMVAPPFMQRVQRADRPRAKHAASLDDQGGPHMRSVLCRFLRFRYSTCLIIHRALHVSPTFLLSLST